MVSKKFTKKELFIGIFCILFVIALLTFYIWHQAETVRLGYRMHELQVEILSIERAIDQLEAEKASLLSLDRVERIARKDLKMELPVEEQVIRNEDEGHSKSE
ncbi:MAG: cell division protein FtsL [Candidatus Aminicenantes bacterium]|nr:cell division protein FtsL [Candidatus Aminicenantes bacterium]